MNQSMRLLSSFEVKDTRDSLKYAYAFMLCKKLYTKECSFINPDPQQIDSQYVYPRDMFSAAYSENDLPPWKEFSSNQTHYLSEGFSCVGSLDKSDQKRMTCGLIDSDVLFCCYGDYEAKAQVIVDEIMEIQKALE